MTTSIVYNNLAEELSDFDQFSQEMIARFLPGGPSAE